MIVNQVLDELGISLDHELSDITPGLDKPHVMSSGPVSSFVLAGRPYNSVSMLTRNPPKSIL